MPFVGDEQPSRETLGDDTPTPLPIGVMCPDCGYDLRGSTSERCPECGFELRTIRSGESLIPWVHRGQLGRFRAYWKTVWLVVRRPKQLDLEMARPVSYADSQSFRRLTVAHAWVPVVLAFAAWYVVARAAGWPVGEGFAWFAGSASVAALVIAACSPGVGTYHFLGRGLGVDRENRAIALAYYGWAPMAFSFAAPALVGAALLCGSPDRSDWHVVLLGVAVICWVMCAAIAWGAQMGLVKRTTHKAWWQLLPRAFLVELLNVGLLLLVVLIPLGVFYLLVIFHSLR